MNYLFFLTILSALETLDQSSPSRLDTDAKSNELRLVRGACRKLQSPVISFYPYQDSDGLQLAAFPLPIPCMLLSEFSS